MRDRDMGEEAVKQLLKDFGLTQTEADIYLFLSKHGSSKGTEMAKRIKKDKAQIYHTLKTLQAKGLVESTIEAPVRFTPVPFDNVVESIIKAKRDEAAKIESTKQELLTYWKSLGKAKPELPFEKFMVIEGRQKVYDKISQMIAKTVNQLSMISTITSLLRGYQYGLYDVISKNKSTSRVQYRLLTELPSQNLPRIKSVIDRISQKGFTFRGRPINIGLELSPQMVLRDGEELLLFINPNVDEQSNEQDHICFWTNCKTIVHSFANIFENQWQNSSALEINIQSTKTGERSRKSDEKKLDNDMFDQGYLEGLRSAKEEIDIITTPSGLVNLLKDFSQLLREQSRMGVSVKILSPIVKDNFEVAEQLSDFCSIRHVPVRYCRTTIIDGKCVFQWRKAVEDTEDANQVSDAKRVFYTEDQEYLRNVKNAFAEIWETSQLPSAVTLESIIGDFAPTIFPLPTSDIRFGSKIIDVEPPGSVTEKDILGKLMNPERIVCADPAKNISRMYASMAKALVHPPESFNLPSLMIQPFHVDKQSSFGAEDYIVILLKLEKSQTSSYIPVAFIGDNPNAQEVIKQVYGGSPAGKNVMLANHDEIQIRVHGNTMFAGWTAPIPLHPTSYVLPPACLLVEAYGNVKTAVWTVLMSSGFKVKVETNYLNAYVTFIHPSSRYSGPGTDAILCRDYISTNYPPQNSSHQD
jgi:sugar-specific transcriptional regulator TrmB